MSIHFVYYPVNCGLLDRSRLSPLSMGPLCNETLIKDMIMYKFAIPDLTQEIVHINSRVGPDPPGVRQDHGTFLLV